MGQMTAARSVLGGGRFVNGRPMLSGASQGTVARKKRPGAKRPAGTMPGKKVSELERDERPTRSRIEQDRRPLNYGKDRPKYRPDQPDAPVIKKKPVTMKGVPKPAKAKGNAKNFGASRA